MTDKRIDRVEMPDGNVHTTTTIVHEEAPRSGVSGWFLMFIVLLAVIVSLWAFSAFDRSEVAKDDAIAQAAGKVGEAADQLGGAAAEIGNAAESAAQNAATQAQEAAESVPAEVTTAPAAE